MSKQAIGIFDSGLGGLTVWKELRAILPRESFIYFADRAHCPYGSRRKKTIQKFSDKIVQFLIAQNCKLIVVACNTATSAAINYLREKYDIPFIGIEPAIKPAAIHSKTGKIGILATRGTLKGKLFKKTSKEYASDLEVIVQFGNGLVELVEAGKINSKTTKELLKSYLNPMLEKGVDHIVLGCTHYPFLSPVIEKIVKGKAKIINPAPAVARQTKKILKEHNLLRKTRNKALHYFYSSDTLPDLHKVFALLDVSLEENSLQCFEHYKI